MITQILTLIATLLTGFLLRQFLRVRIAYGEFKRDAKGLFVVPTKWSPVGQLVELGHDANLQIRIEAYHRKYGKTFGWLYSYHKIAYTIDLELIEAMHLKESGKLINRSKVSFPIVEVDYDCLPSARDDQWRRIRRAIAPSFKKRKVQSQNVVDEVDSVIEHLLNGLEKRLGIKCEAIDLNADDIMLRFATDLIFTCFYKQKDAVDFVSNEDFYTGLIQNCVDKFAQPIVPYAMLFPLLRPVINWIVETVTGIGYGKKLVFSSIDKQMATSGMARKEMDAAKKKGVHIDPDNVKLSDGRIIKRNMIDAFFDSYYDGKVTRTEYINTSLFLFLAGVKTVADAISRLLYYLAIHMPVQEKLRESIIESGTDSEYLTWCINEVLRLEPPVPMGSSRELDKDYKVEGGVVPKGTFVIPHSYTLHRLPEYWGEDASQFKPERWQHADKFHPAQYMPFGLGPRACPGKDLAMVVIRKLMGLLLTRYKFERSSKTSDANLFRSFLHVFVIYEFPTYVRMTRLKL